MTRADLPVLWQLELELGSSDYLVGDRFTIADLTAASLFYPIIRPPTFAYPSVTEVPAAAQEFLDSLAARPGGRWVAMIYKRHRGVD
jgi:glutathione S-transferase